MNRRLPSIEVLTSTRSHAHRSILWTACPTGCPASGRLEITKSKKSTAYLVTEVYPDAGVAGRAFTLRKVDGTTYHLLLAGDRSTCDCPGHTYDASRKADQRHGEQSATLGCCHLDGIESVIDNGWLPDPRENCEQDVGQTEVVEMNDDELPECFRGIGPSRDGCPF